MTTHQGEAMSSTEPTPPMPNARLAEPTAASTWLALAGGPITDQILEWPPDLFALTDALQDHTQAYRSCSLHRAAGRGHPPT